MERRHTTPIWPFMLTAAVLFATSISAPRNWERFAHRAPLRPPAATVAHRASDAPYRVAQTGTLQTPLARTASEFVPPPAAASAPQPPAADVAVIAARPIAVPTPDAKPVVEAETVIGPTIVGGIRLSGAARIYSTSHRPAEHMVALAPVAPKAAPAPVAVPHARSAPADLPQKIVATPTPATEPKTWWPEPVDLLGRLEKLRDKTPPHGWVERTETLLHELTRQSDPTSARTLELLNELRAVVADPTAFHGERVDEATAVELRLTRHALLRRLDVWESLAGVLRTAGVKSNETARHADPRQLELCLVELEAETAAAGETGRQWRNYLLIDSLHRAVRDETSDGERRALAHEVLGRIRRAGSALEQSDFLTQGPFGKLVDSLRNVAEEEVDGRRVLESIETFERGGLPGDAHALAEECRLLEDSSNPSKRQLSTWLTSHYRNANVRVTFSAELLNRLLPDSLKHNAPVNDTILGRQTHGWSTTRTGLSVRFLPSDDRLAMRLEAQGIVNAQTRTFNGPVRLFSHSNSEFAAQKDLKLSPAGLTAEPAVALSNSRTRLRGVESDFDHLPLIGAIVSSIARDKHAESKPAAQREAAGKVARQVERSLDEDIERHLREADARLHAQLLEPLAALRIAPEIIDMQTHDERAAVRLRIAGDDQLAAHTPRPRAYADCLGSVQIHQSAVNNVVERMSLAGHRFTPPELYRRFVQTLHLEERRKPEELPDELELAFASTDPVTLRCDDGRIELRMALDELKFGDKSWKNFTVRASFKPHKIDDRVCLVRDGTVRLSGQLGTTSQLSLRTVFSKIFPDDTSVALWPDALRSDERFTDLDVEQLEIRDGWLGLAIGPRHETQALHRPSLKR